MADILKSYLALSSSSSRTEVSNILGTIINALPFAIDQPSRVELIKALLQDIKVIGSKGRLVSKDAAQALLAVKNLGKDPSGSQVLSSSKNLAMLLGFATGLKDDPEASNEALRCIANCLLLVEDARETLISREVSGGDICLTLLEKSISPDQIFILSRVLFLATASGTTYLQTVVDGKYHGRTVVEVIGFKLDLLSNAVRQCTPTSQEAMTDLLKFAFNLLLHFPKLTEGDAQTSERQEEKVMGDLWSSRLNGLLSPILRVFMTLPPTSPCPITAPLTHTIHSLIAIPINATLRPIWFGHHSTAPSTGSSGSPESRTSQLAEHSTAGSSGDPPTPSSPTSKPSTLDRALSVITAGRRSLSRSSSPNAPHAGDVLQRSYDLLELASNHYMPGMLDPDDVQVRERCKAESTDSLDDMLSPLVVLISRICIADEASRVRLRQRMIPDDLDRSLPLEQRPDILGRCLRLLACVYHPRLKDSVGEMLYAIADSNASTLSSLVGYGNVAGFLFHKGILTAPPAGNTTSLTTPSGDSINPITGTTTQPKSELPEMTEEEKEQEMEKLMVLFARLERTGAISADQNPIRKAIHEGKMG